MIGEEPPFHVRATVIVDDDADESLKLDCPQHRDAYQKPDRGKVHVVSLMNWKRAFNTLFRTLRSGKKELDVDVIDTRRILQLARLLMPTSVSGNGAAAEKLRAYKNPEQCLTDFCDWFEARKSNPASRAKYDFTVDIAPHAIEEYEKWERHQAWNTHHIWEETKKGGRAVKRTGNKITWVSPGILFPLMGALSEFSAMDRAGDWRLKMPSRFKEEEMVRRAVNQFRAYNSDPMQMGRSEAAYDALRIYPQTLVEVLRDIAAER